jgi:hypothetical protein
MTGPAPLPLEPAIVGRLRAAGLDPVESDLRPNAWASRCPHCRIAPTRRWLRVRRMPDETVTLFCSNGCPVTAIAAALDGIEAAR